MIKLENYWERKKRGITNLTNYNFDNLWDYTGELEQSIKEIVDIMLDELGASTKEDNVFLKLTVNNTGFEFMRNLFKLQHYNVPAAPKDTPFYKVSVIFDGQSKGTNEYFFDGGQTNQNTVDALAMLIDELKKEVLKTSEKRPQFMVEPYFWDIVEKHEKHPTAESYRLRKTLSRHFQEEGKIWRQKRKSHNSKYQESIEQLYKIKSKLPHSVNLLYSMGGKLAKENKNYYRAMFTLENGETTAGMMELSPYVAAKNLFKMLPELKFELAS